MNLDYAEEVLRHLKASDVIRLEQELVRIDSRTGKEHEISDFVFDKMKDVGLKVRRDHVRDGRSNVLGTIIGTQASPSLMLNGHLDTQAVVQGWSVNPFRGIIKNRRIYGLGAADQKAGVASMISAAKALVEANVPLRGDLVVAAVIGHMEGGVGTRHLLKKGKRTSFAIVTEPTEMKLVVEGGGIAYFQIESRGRAAHTPKKHSGINAIVKMTKIVQALEKYQFHARRTKYLAKPYLNVGTISGGIWPSIVPDRCKAEIDVRFLPTQTAAGVKREIEDIIKKLKRRDSYLDVKVSFLPNALENPRYTFRRRLSDRIVTSCSRAVKQLTGRPPHFAGFQGWTDASVLNKAGIKSIVYGPGDWLSIYAPDEYVACNDLVLASKVYALTTLSICS